MLRFAFVIFVAMVLAFAVTWLGVWADTVIQYLVTGIVAALAAALTDRATKEGFVFVAALIVLGFGLLAFGIDRYAWIGFSGLGMLAALVVAIFMPRSSAGPFMRPASHRHE